jgi:branched-chain amino acid transport system substrate-binding protein
MSSELAESKIRRWAERLWAFFHTAVVVPLILGLISIAVVGRVIDWLTGPKAYFAYVVGDFSDPNVQRFWHEVDDKRNSGFSIGGTDIKILPLSAKERDAGKISSKLSEKVYTLMVIGHTSSTASLHALPNYLSAKPPIPVILPLETNPELLPPEVETTYAPVFRLSPTDDRQAEKAADFMLDQNAKAIWVIEDAITNTVYSRYLVSELVKQIDMKTNRHQVAIKGDNKCTTENMIATNTGRPAAAQQNCDFVQSKDRGRVVLWTTNINAPSPDLPKKLNIDWIFVAANPRNCLMISRQIRNLYDKTLEKKPNLLLSNSCVSEKILSESGDELKEVFLTHHMLASEYDRGGYGYRGQQAFSLFKQLIETADSDFDELKCKRPSIYEYILCHGRQFLGWHSVSDARSAISASMQNAAMNGKLFLLGDEEYRFNPDGTIKENTFHVWKVLTLSNKLNFTDFE